MFVQVIQGHVSDPAAIREAFDTWHRDLSAGADGWLGTTAGVTADGELVSVVRFDSAESAERNSHRSEQHQWWMETAKLFAGDVAFHDCHQVDTFLDGGSDDAGFVQVLKGHTSNAERLWELNRQAEPMMRERRPDIIGGLATTYGDGEVLQVVYFRSEAEAREGERSSPPMEETEQFEGEPELFTEVSYYDLTEPWHYSRER